MSEQPPIIILGCERRKYRDCGKLPKGLLIGSLIVMAVACIILSWLTSPAPQQELQSTDRTMPIEAQHESTP